MAAHDVRLKIPATIDVSHQDLKIEVRTNGDKLGTLLISKGNVEWIPRFKQRKRRLSWAKFDELMQSTGRPKQK